MSELRKTKTENPNFITLPVVGGLIFSQGQYIRKLSLIVLNFAGLINIWKISAM